MRRLLILIPLVAVLAAPATAAGMAPTRLSFDVTATFFASFTSAHCGIPVYISQEGTAEVTLFYNESGQIVRDLSRVIGGSITLFSPSDQPGGTGQSFTIIGSSVTMVDYGAGATIGSPATITFVGFAGSATGPGSDVSAGQQVITGTVVGFTAEGVPIVDTAGGTPIRHGHFVDFSVVFPQRCEALGGTSDL
jgi:hypothetical protein